jgi:hypothetical protein
LFSVLTRVGHLDVSDLAEVRSVHAALVDLLERLSEHLELENVHLHPVIESIQPGATERATADHLNQESNLEALARAADELGRRVSLGFFAEAQAMARSLYLRLTGFAAENLEHMQHEESELLRLLWLTYDDAQLELLIVRLLSSASEQHLRNYLQWALFACNPGERQRLIALAVRQLPAVRLEALIAQARSCLPEPEFLILTAELQAMRMPRR